MEKQASMQDMFMQNLKDTQVPCTVITKNGYQIRCKVLDFDTYTILVDHDGVEELVYKSAISTVSSAVGRKK